MKILKCVLLGLSLVSGAALAHTDIGSVDCTYCNDWNKQQKPFNIHGNAWYVGTSGLAAVLITGPQGHILLDGALPQSAPLILRNIAALGFRVQDIKLIVNSHAHFDHAGAIPALQRASGAVVAASASGAQVLRDGAPGKDDPQYESPYPQRIAGVEQVKVVRDKEVLTVGPLSITAHMTPGHTPGATSWTWKSCENGRCLDMVYADSLNAVSVDGFYFSGRGAQPDISASFRASIDKVAALPCDVVVSVHPGFTSTFEKLAAKTPANNPFVAPGGCRAYAEAARKSLEQRLAREAGEKSRARGH